MLADFFSFSTVELFFFSYFLLYFSCSCYYFSVCFCYIPFSHLCLQRKCLCTRFNEITCSYLWIYFCWMGINFFKTLILKCILWGKNQLYIAKRLFKNYFWDSFGLFKASIFIQFLPFYFMKQFYLTSENNNFT